MMMNRKKHNSKDMEEKLLTYRLAWLIVGYTKLWVHSFLYMVVFFFFCRHHKTACRQADGQIVHQSQTKPRSMRIMQPNLHMIHWLTWICGWFSDAFNIRLHVLSSGRTVSE